MANLFSLADLSIPEVNKILSRAEAFLNGATSRAAEDKVIASLFFEPSTRTQQSFSMAAYRMGAKVLTFNADNSSMQKGETFYDTVKTFEQIGSDALIIRHKENEYYKQLTGVKVPILSGGDGTGNHPTQSLLDLLTIRQEFGRFEGLKICIVGDILHSRVAHTNMEIMRRLGMEVYTSGPEEFREEGCDFIEFTKAAETMDILMLLRIQHERLEGSMQMTPDAYNREFGLNAARAAQMKDNAIIMHPAPFNRGVEIDDDMVEGPRSRIFKQIRNGVFIRMAVIERAFSE
jgi:aspartate carbamoyltransferase catalytic subunit